MADFAFWAARLGMKTSEVVAVRIDGGQTVVTTHDGIRTVVPQDGGPLVFLKPTDVGPDPTAEVAAPALPDVETPAGDGVPAGSVKDVLAWVGADLDRAAAALVAEGSRDQPRASLIRELERIGGVDA